MNKRSDNDLFNPFNLSDFKKWMGHQHDAKIKPNMVGTHVESKIALKKLTSRIETEGDADEVAKDFKENGGMISEVIGHNFTIDVDSGSFTIHRMYVKKLDD